MSTEATEPDVHEMWAQLTVGHTNVQPYDLERETRPGQWVTVGERHYGTTVPALILQLLVSDPGVTGTGDLSGAKPASRPTARIEALDTVMLIDDEAGDWILDLGGQVPADPIDPQTFLTVTGVGTVHRLERLHGLYPSTADCGKPKHRKDDEKAWCCTRGHLEGDVRRWWRQARIITGWDMAAWIPNNTCPVVTCGARRKLRIRIDSAMCVECRTTWPADQLGLLAEHIRTENREEDTRTVECA